MLLLVRWIKIKNSSSLLEIASAYVIYFKLFPKKNKKKKRESDKGLRWVELSDQSWYMNPLDLGRDRNRDPSLIYGEALLALETS